MLDAIQVIQYGLGPIGCALASHVVERAGLELAGGVDIDPAKVAGKLASTVGLAVAGPEA